MSNSDYDFGRFNFCGCLLCNFKLSVFFHWLRVALCQVTTRFEMFCINTEVVS